MCFLELRRDDDAAREPPRGTGDGKTRSKTLPTAKVATGRNSLEVIPSDKTAASNDKEVGLTGAAARAKAFAINNLVDEVKPSSH